MKSRSLSLALLISASFILILYLLLADHPRSVYASSIDNPVFIPVQITDVPPVEPTLTPLPDQGASFNPDSISVTLIFETIFKWLFGKNLTEIFNEVEFTEEQKKQIELLTGETNPLNLVNNFCIQVRSGDFSRMAESVRESNRDDGSGALSPSILMDFFEQLGAFCPVE